ncbi:MAG: phosphoribosylaminoimidazole carboxylase [candidate division Zixibacteria bacterium SM1_73]|nr:MAG: phosphoribosylaminoimidazole carboxylase [candidate division Zixibacteria bacterium SM1_73]
MRVAVLIGSDSDYEVVQEAIKIFQEFKVEFALEVTSAHRSPERTVRLVKDFEQKGAEVFIAVAGKAAHLAGAVASQTDRPVIGVPVENFELGGLDALLSTVQMPKGVPVATMGLGKSGAANAAFLVVQILALKDSGLKKKFKAYKKKLAAQVEKKSQKVKKNL